MHDKECVFVHLLDDEANFSHTPDVVRIANIDKRVDIKFSHLTLQLRLLVVFLSLEPVTLNLRVLCVLNELVYDIIHFETDGLGLIPDDYALHAIKIADKARL